MNLGLADLYRINEELNCDGWLVIPPSNNRNILKLRAEWHIDGLKYAYQQEFTKECIEAAAIDLVDMFIVFANREIKKVMDGEI